MEVTILSTRNAREHNAPSSCNYLLHQPYLCGEGVEHQRLLGAVFGRPRGTAEVSCSNLETVNEISFIPASTHLSVYWTLRAISRSTQHSPSISDWPWCSLTEVSCIENSISIGDLLVAIVFGRVMTDQDSGLADADRRK